MCQTPAPPPSRDFRVKKNHTRILNHYEVIQSHNVALHLRSNLIPNISDYFNRTGVKSMQAHAKCYILILTHLSGKTEVVGGKMQELPICGLLALVTIWSHKLESDHAVLKIASQGLLPLTGSSLWLFPHFSSVPTSLASDMPYSISLPLLVNAFFFPHSSLSSVWRSKHCYRQQANTLLSHFQPLLSCS